MLYYAPEPGDTLYYIQSPGCFIRYEVIGPYMVSVGLRGRMTKETHPDIIEIRDSPYRKSTIIIWRDNPRLAGSIQELLELNQYSQPLTLQPGGVAVAAINESDWDEY